MAAEQQAQAQHAIVLSANNVTAGFGNSTVVANASLQCRTGETLVIAGPNGAGKSTLLKTLGRQLKPLAGQVTIGGDDIQMMAPRQFARLVAYVQDIQPAGDLTVEEMVQLGRSPHQMWWQWHNSPADRAAVAKAITLTGLSGFEKRLFSKLSAGERQRTIVAMSLCQEASFLLLDEPTSHLDFKHQLELLSLIGELKKTGFGIVVILHDLNLMARCADRVVLLKRNESQPTSIVSSGPARDVLAPHLLEDVFDVEVSIVQEGDEKIYSIR